MECVPNGNDVTTMVLGEMALSAVTVGADVSCRDVESLFAKEPHLSCAVVLGDDVKHLVPRRCFMMEMAGSMGYGRALHHRRPVVELAREIPTLRLSATLDLEEAGRRALARDSRWRYDDILVEGGDCLCTVSVADLFSRLAAINESRSLRDPLTGLANRTGFARSVGGAVDGANWSPDSTAVVLFIDIDDFKSVNDSLGHAAGDSVLTQLAARMRTSLRDGDVVARLGGDEFAVLLPRANRTAAEAAADRILRLVAQPITVGTQTFALRASVGIAMQDGPHEPVELLLRNADLAMYEAKRQGKGRRAIYGQELHDQAAGRLDLRTELEFALDRNEMSVHYQPIVDLVADRVVGVEALLRWNHPRLGNVSPLTFLPTAEESGVIVPIGIWVMREASRQAATWQRQNPDHQDLRLSVNVSVRQLDDPQFANAVSDALATTGLSPHRLTLEITESALVPRSSNVIETIRTIERIGVRLAIDDFGTGFSSFARLTRLPLHELKIDRHFTQQLEAPQTQDVLRGLVGLADAMGVDATIEGIETAEQADILRSIGFTRGQGFYYSTPRPADEIPGIVASPLVS